MKSQARESSFIALVIRSIGGLLLVGSIFLAPARTGIGSTISLHELFDLLLAERIPMLIPRWIGLFGYAPALGGALILLAEAFPGRSRSVIRTVGSVLAGISVIVLATQGPWNSVGLLGPALWVGFAGLLLAMCGTVVDVGTARFGARLSPTGDAGPCNSIDTPVDVNETEGVNDVLRPMWP